MATVEDQHAASTGLIPSVWENGITLQGVSWDTYCKFVDGLGERRMFVTYDNGTMEIQTVSPSFPHENSGCYLERFIHLVAFIKRLDITSGGSVTHRHQELEQGQEPDSCFWIEQSPKVRGMRELDLSEVPAPDLVIEVDIHASSLDRIEGFRKLGVPEIWHIQDGKLRFLVIDGGGYSVSPMSRSFPFVDAACVAESLGQIESLGDTEALNRLLSKLKLR